MEISNEHKIDSHIHTKHHDIYHRRYSQTICSLTSCTTVTISQDLKERESEK